MESRPCAPCTSPLPPCSHPCPRFLNFPVRGKRKTEERQADGVLETRPLSSPSPDRSPIVSGAPTEKAITQHSRPFPEGRRFEPHGRPTSDLGDVLQLLSNLYPVCDVVQGHWDLIRLLCGSPKAGMAIHQLQCQRILWVGSRRLVELPARLSGKLL